MKRKIDINNYEEFFLDYLDGSLSDKEITDLEKFLLENPELRDELEGMENIELTPVNEKYSHPENLKQIDLTEPVNDHNFDFYCIAELEGDLSADQSRAFNDYLQENPSKAREHELMLKTRVKSEGNLLYTDKSKIKKSIFLVYRKEFITAASIAAGMALLITFWFSFMDRVPEFNEMAVLDDKGKEATEVTDSTSALKSAGQDKKSPGEEKGILKNIEEKSKQAVKKAATRISFKTGIPIASAETIQDTVNKIPVDTVERDELLKNISINTGLLSEVTPLDPISNDVMKPTMNYVVRPQKPSENANEYITLQEFAVQKLTDIIFREEEKELNAVNLASAGINKINNVAGTNMKLEASAREETGEKILSFNSGLISFSTPINRED